MKCIERRLLDIRRMGNNATDKEWAVVYNWLSTGRLNSKKDAEIVILILVAIKSGIILCIRKILLNGIFYFSILRIHLFLCFFVWRMTRL